ncbi:hypothetical protein [Streptomyces sp. NPDC049881]|uniref:hypothetical protein n=1 Tax=Streptomyces sp. NPDC049881 TaxID=3155778 RepID=UPI00343FCEBE
MDEVGGRLFLRPPGGGREWSVDPAEVEPVPEPSAADALRVRLREINVRSRRGRSGDASG